MTNTQVETTPRQHSGQNIKKYRRYEEPYIDFHRFINPCLSLHESGDIRIPRIQQTKVIFSTSSPGPGQSLLTLSLLTSYWLLSERVITDILLALVRTSHDWHLYWLWSERVITGILLALVRTCHYRYLIVSGQSVSLLVSRWLWSERVITGISLALVRTCHYWLLIVSGQDVSLLEFHWLWSERVITGLSFSLVRKYH